MATFTRKNALLCTMSLTAADGSGTQPNTATLHLVFQDLNRRAQTSTIALTFDPVAKTWGGVWDSSLAGECEVSWVVYTDLSIEAAAQGVFQIEANRANTN